MSTHLLASRRLTIVLLLTVAVATWAFASAAILARGHEGVHLTDRTVLLTTNRTGLKLCVESLVPGIDLQTIQGRARGAMTSVSNHPHFQLAGLGSKPVAVDIDCPAPPTILDPRYRPSSRLGAPVSVTDPSQYRLFVFIVSPEQAAQAFGDRPLRRTAQEMLCEGGVCSVVTVALYLTPADLADPAVLVRGLTDGIGLWPEGKPFFDARPQPIDPRGK